MGRQIPRRRPADSTVSADDEETVLNCDEPYEFLRRNQTSFRSGDSTGEAGASLQASTDLAHLAPEGAFRATRDISDTELTVADAAELPDSLTIEGSGSDHELSSLLKGTFYILSG
jgi:hypothetical protein